jgi:hypothetical protein
MTSYPIQQEILLLSNSTFSQRELQNSVFPKIQNGQLFGKRFEKALRNNLLDIVLPEISEKWISGKKLNLWNIRYSNAFVEIELGNHPELVERRYSIDPYEFMPAHCGN